MTYTLRPHQQRAYQNITKHLPNKDRLQYISACGTGKTLVGFNLIQGEDRSIGCYKSCLETKGT